MTTRKRRTDEERLEELNRKKAAIEARQKIRNRVAKKERARDTRRKVLVVPPDRDQRP